MTSVSTTTVTDPSSVNTESAGVEDAESSQGGKPAQLESGNDLTAEEEALLLRQEPRMVLSGEEMFEICKETWDKIGPKDFGPTSRRRRRCGSSARGIRERG